MVVEDWSSERSDGGAVACCWNRPIIGLAEGTAGGGIPLPGATAGRPRPATKGRTMPGAVAKAGRCCAVAAAEAAAAAEVLEPRGAAGAEAGAEEVHGPWRPGGGAGGRRTPLVAAAALMGGDIRGEARTGAKPGAGDVAPASEAMIGRAGRMGRADDCCCCCNVCACCCCCC